MRTPRLTASLLAVASTVGGLLTAVVVGTAAAPPAAAADASGFNPGMIISDATFYNASTMNAGQIQNFLAAQYNGCASGYTCIRDLRVDTFDRAAVSGLCNAYDGAAGEQASVILAKVAQACGVNPQSLIVLLQKESSVITSTTPNYRSATGYGCPDTAACDSRYYGFYNQVYMAAYQFKRYRMYPTNYGYVAGRTNYIQYNPNASCGGSNVYIQNQATAGLYVYTPYQPNAAALKNFYGTGDSCSAYGNRNFYRMFADWFGSTSAPVNIVVKTADDSTLYVASGRNKYPIDTWETYLALPASWRTITTVSQSTADSFTTGTTLQRLVRGADGTISLFDAGIKLRMPTCDMVADYGYSCSKPIPLLADADLAAFRTGPTMTSLYTTTTGRRYLVGDGGKREVLDDGSLAQLGASTATVVLTPTPIAGLRLGDPVVRDGVVIFDRADGSAALLRSGVTFRWSASTYEQSVLVKALPATAALDGDSVAKLPRQVELGPFAKDATTGSSYVVTASGRSAITASQWGTTPSTWPSDLLGAVPSAPPLAAPQWVKATNGATVAQVGDGTARPVGSWAALTTLAGDSAPYIAVLPDAAFALVPAGPQLLTPATLAKGNASDIYFIDGADRRTHVASWVIATQLGLTSWVTDNAAVSTYRSTPGDLSPAFVCNGQRFLGAGGAVRAVSADQATAWGLPFVPVSAPTCLALAGRAGAALGGALFVRTVDDATVYQLGDRTKRPVTSWTALERVLPSSAVGLQYLPSGALSGVPTGSPIS